jgi:hypothetical protein
MGSHSNSEIEKHVKSSEELIEQMNKLQDALADTLKIEFKKTVGIELPTAIQAKVLKTDAAMIYSTEAKIDEFVTGASTLANAALGSDLPEVVNAATQVATVAAKTILGGGQIQVGFQGDSAMVTHGEDQWLIAAYSSNQICTSEQWFSDKDFFVGKYVYLILQVTNNPFFNPSSVTFLSRDLSEV